MFKNSGVFRHAIQSSEMGFEVYEFPNELFFMCRHQKYQTKDFFDTYASNWFVGIIPPWSHGIKIQSGQEFVTIQPGEVLFLPPFSIAHWQPLHTITEWWAFMGTFPLSGLAGRLRFKFKLTSLDLPSASWDFKVWLNLGFERKDQILKDQNKSSAVASKLKARIDKHFNEDVLIGDLARDIGHSRVVLSKSFSEAYGMSPTEYRNKLRVFNCLRDFSFFKNVSEAYCGSGFNHNGLYIRHFKNYLGFNPRVYHARHR